MTWLRIMKAREIGGSGAERAAARGQRWRARGGRKARGAEGSGRRNVWGGAEERRSRQKRGSRRRQKASQWRRRREARAGWPAARGAHRCTMQPASWRSRARLRQREGAVGLAPHRSHRGPRKQAHGTRCFLPTRRFPPTPPASARSRHKQHANDLPERRRQARSLQRALHEGRMFWWPHRRECCTVSSPGSVCRSGCGRQPFFRCTALQ